MGLSGCSGKKDAFQTFYAPAKTDPVPIQHPPLPADLRLQSMPGKWVVLTPDAVVEMVRPLDANLAESIRLFFVKHPDKTFLLLAITEEQYKALGANNLEIARYLRDLNTLIAYYRKL
jgi:hypothetical protein